VTQSNETKKPSPKLRSRKAIAAWILDALEDGYDRHEQETFIFCLDTEDSSADFSFDHLLEVYQKGEGGEAAKDPLWIKHVRRHFAKEYCKWEPDGLDQEEDDVPEEDQFPPDDYDLDPTEHGCYTLYEWANDDMQRLFGTSLKSGVPDDDCWNTLPDGTEVAVKFGWVDRGYGDNTLVLAEFEGYKCTEDDLGYRLKIDAEGLKPTYWHQIKGETIERDYDPDDTGPLSWKELKLLYEYVKMIKDWFDAGHYKQEMEYQASWSFFENICEGEDFPNPTQDRIDAEWTQKRKDAERARQLAFLDTFRGTGRRAVATITPGKRLKRSHTLRRRVEFVDAML